MLVISNSRSSVELLELVSIVVVSCNVDVAGVVSCDVEVVGVVSCNVDVSSEGGCWGCILYC